MKIIFLIMIGLSVAHSGMTRSNGVVTDSLRGLEWQDKETSKKLYWEDAIKHCERLALNGSYDWRLPNINELNSITDYSKQNHITYFLNGRLESDVLSMAKEFVYYKPNYYWSSTAVKNHEDKVWGVDFQRGKVYIHDKKDLLSFYVRCVRNVD